MIDKPDARLPVRFVAPIALAGLDRAGSGAAVLIEGDAPAPQRVPYARFTLAPGAPGAWLHGRGCACCVPRGAAAQAFGR
ncbi:MAG: hypothetical protein KGL52_06725, partial [Rhodospirillales bacterium]|nr:hypothetical protein [Rhodospirillales bacterium]